MKFVNVFDSMKSMRKRKKKFQSFFFFFLLQILRSSEGQQLRHLHQENVAYLKDLLTRARLPQMPSKSHIIPIPVGDPVVCAWICDELMTRHNHYVQSINYPTVPKGTERLRVAPTPFHTREMMEEFVFQLLRVWNDAGLPLLAENGTTDQLKAETCSYCHRTADDPAFKFQCDLDQACPQYTRVH